MIKEAIKEAETIEEAKALALAELGVNEDKAQFEVLVQPEKKKFGLFGGSLAKVEYFMRKPQQKLRRHLFLMFSQSLVLLM